MTQSSREILSFDSGRAAIRLSLHGAQVLSFAPRGGTDLLWCSPIHPPHPKPIRGGVPLCWPWFARQGAPTDAPQHGFARTADWQLTESRGAADGGLLLRLCPKAPLPGSAALRLEIELTDSLTMRMISSLPSDQPACSITEAFHNYFAVADPRRLTIDGLAQTPMIDNLAGAAHAITPSPYQPSLPCERIHYDCDGPLELHDRVGARRITINRRGAGATIVWHPGPQAAHGFADLPGQSWQAFICVEIGNCEPQPVRLEPGQTHICEQTIGLRRA